MSACSTESLSIRNRKTNQRLTLPNPSLSILMPYEILAVYWEINSRPTSHFPLAKLKNWEKRERQDAHTLLSWLDSGSVVEKLAPPINPGKARLAGRTLIGHLAWESHCVTPHCRTANQPEILRFHSISTGDTLSQPDPSNHQPT